MRLYGRETESRRIDSLLDAARAGRSGALLLRGQPGTGKTALLRSAVARAVGMTVLQARGLEVEAQLAFSGLSDLFGPVIDLIETIPAPQAAALAGALAVGPAVAADRFVVSVATLSLLAAASDARPVLAVVDDGHWIDDASREALLFAARRLEAERVAVIMAGLDSEGALDWSGLDELAVSGLDRAAAAQLLEEDLDRPIAPRVLNRLMDATAGNPLALREFAAELTKRHSSAGQNRSETGFPRR
jgi:predicted ATPase